jgi:hypothetical protein
MIAWLFMHRLLCMASPAEGTPTTRSLTAQPQTRRYKAIYESHPFCNPGEVGVTCENVRMAERVANAALKKHNRKINNAEETLEPIVETIGDNVDPQ